MLKDKFGFNFWPSFTDLMLAFVLIVLLMLLISFHQLAVKSANLEEIHTHQDTVSEQITKKLDQNKFPVEVVDQNKDYADHKDNAAVFIINKLDRQTITFSDKVLFDSGESALKPSGRELLKEVGAVIAAQSKNISQIQIQGHTDFTGDDNMNLQLGADRAIAVYQMLQYEVGINPAQHLMSVTSFGRYKPVARTSGMDYDLTQLGKDNGVDQAGPMGDDRVKAKNRRIEIVLFYKSTK